MAALETSSVHLHASSFIHSLPLNSPPIPGTPLSSPLLPSFLYCLWLRYLGGWASWTPHVEVLHHFPAYSNRLVLDSLLLIPSCTFWGTNSRNSNHAAVARWGYTGRPRLTAAVMDLRLLWDNENKLQNFLSKRRFVLRIVLCNPWNYLLYINVRKDFAIYLSVCTFL